MDLHDQDPVDTEHTVRQRKGGRLPAIGIAAAAVALAVAATTLPSALNPLAEERFCDKPWVLKGPILAKYKELGGPDKAPYCPVGPITATPDGHGQYAQFHDGLIYWSDNTGAHPVWGEISKKWEALGRAAGKLGYPMADEQETDKGGRRQEFQHGTIYYFSPAEGAHAVWDEIGEKWGQLHWESGPLGFPVTDERTNPDGGKSQDFEGGTIAWHPSRSHGAHAVLVKIKEKWLQHGAASGDYGYPVADEVYRDSVYSQEFERGVIRWDVVIGGYR
jgi:uncharacterized protein with LGFP repeats